MIKRISSVDQDDPETDKFFEEIQKKIKKHPRYTNGPHFEIIPYQAKDNLITYLLYKNKAVAIISQRRDGFNNTESLLIPILNDLENFI